MTDTPATRAALPLHILGVGPANGSVPWRGAANHGVPGGAVARLSRPAFPLPTTTSRHFVLRLSGDNEASTSHELDRDTALIIEEHFTDLWWRRRDPNRDTLDMLGRFNADKIDLSGQARTVQLNVSWVDYKTLIGRRLVLAWKDTTAKTSHWNKGATVTEIIRFALPTNTNVDLTDATTVNLGTIKEAFDLPVGTPVHTVMENLVALSTTKWEWWVDTPATDTSPPKLRLLAGGRGVDRGITLFDVDGMRGPVASWTRSTSGEDYANALFFSGKDGGVVITLPEQISAYGQHDATDNDNSIGTGKQLDAAADKRLHELATRAPTYTVVLRQGFWEGREHIDVGDWVNLHLKLGAELLAGSHQVTEISGEIDASDMETITLTLGPPKVASDPRSPRSAVSRIVKRLKDATPKGTVTTT